MNEEQKAQALALLGIPEIRETAEGFRTTKLYFCSEWWDGRAKFCAPNLADETGAVEGWLHRVLEKLVGEAVELTELSKRTPGPEAWVAWSRSQRILSPIAPPNGYPTRLEAIVAALLALEVK